jgi:hypothetical protein
MKAVLIFSGMGPVLLLTSYESITHPKFIEKLTTKGIKKFIGFELPLELVKEKYGAHYEAILNDVQQSDDLRVLDYDGHNVIYNFSFKDMGQPTFYEPNQE